MIEILYDERLRGDRDLVFELLLYSGIMFSEAIKLINEFDEDKLECFNRLCRYGLFWMRGRKRCDWIYLPIKLVEKLRRYEGYYRGRKLHGLGRYCSGNYSIESVGRCQMRRYATLLNRG